MVDIRIPLAYKMTSEDEGIWDSTENRAWVLSELEQIFDTYGNPMPKGSAEMESQLYDKARTQDQYMTLARRLLRTVLEMAQKRSTRSAEVIAEGRAALERMNSNIMADTDFKFKMPPSPMSSLTPSSPALSDSASRTDVSPNPFRVKGTDRSAGVVLTDAVFPNPFTPAANPRKTTPPEQACPVTVESVPVAVPQPLHFVAQPLVSMESTSLPSSFNRKKISYGSIKLPPPNKRVFVFPENPAKSQSRSYGESLDAIDDPVEVTTRIIVEDSPHKSSSKAPVPGSDYLSFEFNNSGTYEAALNLLIPKGCLINQITVGLRKDQD
ncbi:hypothetical protein RvY_14389-2 [Ramazzottius varieornatus]|uniref:Mediator of RNA polymerase II transcription subunit 15 n=1 Tax=Ramazzottius varieornatus TaxID=947166 RepID=A0A1D1VR76_RAMVA|nr:hypothetical protein RvY_14389-2 [Ramazzottius varieornatus]